MLRLLVGLLGFALFAVIVWDAIETVLVPRRIGRRFRLTRFFYIVTWRAWRAMVAPVRRAPRREAILGFYGPLSLVMLLAFWAFGFVVAFALMGWAVRTPGEVTRHGFPLLLYMSGETFFTIGFGDFTQASPVGRFLAVLEGGLGFGFLGTVVGYLPTMYSAFSEREVEISLMDAHAGSPPTAAEFLRRNPAGTVGCVERLRTWERWSAQLLERHISYPQLAYYRSQHVNQSWLASLTMILDSTAVVLARSGDGMHEQAHHTFAMARHALVDITQVFFRRYRPFTNSRMSDAQMAAIRSAIAAGGGAPVSPAAFERRLTELRILYEPYAQALAAYLLLELPPWAHLEPRRDNWERGPWDRMLPGTEEALSHEEHF